MPDNAYSKAEKLARELLERGLADWKEFEDDPEYGGTQFDCVADSFAPVFKMLYDLAKDTLEITSGELGTTIRKVAVEAKNSEGLWPRTHATAKAVISLF